MAVKIRFQRGGRTNRAHFRLVAIDERTRRDGKALEILGHYDPIKPGDNFVCDKQRVEHWLSHGAIPSETVTTFLRKQGITLPQRSPKRRKRRKRRQVAAS